MTSERPKTVFDSLVLLGCNPIDCGETYRVNAIYRSGNNNTSVSVFKANGVWVDFGLDNTPRPFKELVKKCLNTTAKNQVRAYLPEALESGGLQRSARQPKIEHETVYCPSDVNELLVPNYKFYMDRKISPKTLVKFKSGLFISSGDMNGRYTFPIYNDVGLIHGFAGRDILNRPHAPKWKIIGKKRNFVYPFRVDPSFSEAVKNSREVFVVESVGDALAFSENGLDNVAVTFGVSLSNKLAMFLSSFQRLKIWLCYNNDYSKGERNTGLIGSIKDYLVLSKTFDHDQLGICLPIGNDFGEMQQEGVFDKWREKLQHRRTDPLYRHSQIIDIAAKFVKQGVIPKRFLNDD
jgi:hypothetical protein